MTGTWTRVDVGGKQADVFEPAGRPRFGVIHLHGVGLETAAGNDAGLNWCLTFRAPDTAGSANGSCKAFVINEVLYHAPDSLDRLQFIELHNPGDREVDLAGWKLAGGVKYLFPAKATIE